MTSTKDNILNKLRKARRPFVDAEPQPQAYMPVTSIADTSPEAMLERFQAELTRLSGEVFVVQDDAEARETLLGLLESHNTRRILAWDFKYIPVDGLQDAIMKDGYTIDFPNIHLEDAARAAHIKNIESAEVGLTGVDAAAATTGTLIVSTAPGKGRIPTVLPPVHIALVELHQLVPRIEDWLAQVREFGNEVLETSSNLCFISGPSRTADIEKQLVLGVHGPKQLQVIVKK